MEAPNYTFDGAEWTVRANKAAPVPVHFDEAAAVRALLALRADEPPALIKSVLDCFYKVIRQMGWQQTQRDAMTSLIQQIEQMRTRMNELAAGEQDLVRALGEALSRTDQKLLEDVRSVAADHEARRGAILNELQSLAARMGALPKPLEPYAALTEAPQRAVRLGGADGAVPRPQEPYDALTVAPLDLPPCEMPQLTSGGGDWRKAAANIEDAINYHMNGRAASAT
jgi:hypothetical protein